MRDSQSKARDKDRRKLLEAVQDGLPLVAKPYEAVARRLGWTEEAVVEGLKSLLAAGIIRRLAGIVDHRKVGVRANALVLWCVPEDLVEQSAERIARFQEVSHCYQRASAPEMPYNLYAMVHGRERCQCDRTLEEIQDAIGPFPRLILWSTQEFKKSGVQLLSGHEFADCFPEAE